MAHARQQIRDAILTALTGLSTTGTNAYASRVYPMDSAKLPGLIVYTKNEDTEIATIGPNALLTRDLEVVVEAYVKSASADDTIDTICAEVETALPAASGVTDLVKWILPGSLEVELSGEGDTMAAIATIIFNCRYCTREGAPTVIV